jgi:hypothetical protein
MTRARRTLLMPMFVDFVSTRESSLEYVLRRWEKQVGEAQKIDLTALLFEDCIRRRHNSLGAKQKTCVTDLVVLFSVRVLERTNYTKMTNAVASSVAFAVVAITTA